MKVIDRIIGGFNQVTGQKEKDRQFNALRAICQEYIANREKLTKKAQSLYDKRKTYLKTIQSIDSQLSSISNLPKWCKVEIDESLELVKDFQLAVEYEKSPVEFAQLKDQSGRTADYMKKGGKEDAASRKADKATVTFMTAGGAAGIATAAFGSTAAMSLATTLGTTSTGVAISTLSGAAATNAALAWLGGGAAAAGGAGIAGGNLILAMFGPIGISIAGVSAAVGIGIIRKRNSNDAKKAEAEKENIKRDNKILKGMIAELEAIRNRSTTLAKDKLNPSLQWLEEVEPKDYKKWTKEQKHELEVLVNNVSNMAQLINQRV